MFSQILNKMKVVLGLGVVLQVVRVFFPSLDVGEDFEGAAKAVIEAVYVLVPIIAGWFVKESPATADALVLK